MVISTSLSHVQVSSILGFFSYLSTFPEQSRGIATYMGSALETPASELRDHLDVSVTFTFHFYDILWISQLGERYWDTCSLPICLLSP